MEKIDLSKIEPFEIASIRPPTENYSLSFRVTRNCYWNKCAYCPVYKTGLKFSKRPLEEIKADISRARMIDDVLYQNGFGSPYYSDTDYYKASSLIEKIRTGRMDAGNPVAEEEPKCIDENIDERMKWFMSWFKDKPVLEDSIYHMITWRIDGGRTCFLGDADSLILTPDFLRQVMSFIKENFLSLQRFTIYGRTRTAAQVRTLQELREFYNAGLNRVHFGLESGSDNVLSLVNKGVTSAQHIEGCLKTKESGLSCSIYVMPGLGGHNLSQENASETARVINAIEPDFVRLRTLEIFPSTPLEEMRRTGAFTEASEEEVVLELKTLIENINCNTQILSDSASNLLDINGNLPYDKSMMIGRINSYLSLTPRDKLEFSFNSRLGSFLGQYGTVSDDILSAISPYIVKNSVDTKSMTDSTLSSVIRLIRSKLMP